MSTSGFSASRAAGETFVTGPHGPATGWTRNCTRSREPSLRYHTTIPSPVSSIATRGPKAFTPATDRSVTALHTPAAVRVRAWARVFAPSSRIQETIASPSSSTATRGSRASPPAADSVTIGPSTPLFERVRDWMRSLVPSERVHTIRPSPSSSSATRGSTECWPGLESGPDTGPQVPAAVRGRASMRLKPLPSTRFHTATASPFRSIAMCGLFASRPAPERKAGSVQLAEAVIGASASTAIPDAHAARLILDLIPTPLLACYMAENQPYSPRQGRSSGAPELAAVRVALRLPPL